jgi:hypothetical protein
VKQMLMPFPPTLEHCPELAALAILDAALCASEYALLAVCPEILHGASDGAPRGSTVVRANALILQARRLAAAIAAYRNAVERDARRADRERHSSSF